MKDRMTAKNKALAEKLIREMKKLTPEEKRFLLWVLKTLGKHEIKYVNSKSVRWGLLP